MTQEPEVFEVLRKVRYDLTAAQAKLSEAFRMLADMNLPGEREGIPCPRCGADIKGERALAFHLYNVHGKGELPPLSAEEEAA